MVRVAPGLTQDEAMERLRPISGSEGTAITPVVPTEIDRVRRIDGLPVALAVFVALVALAAVGFALVTAVRRRSRELAVLKTLGFSRRQVRATFAWHASTVAAVGVVVGIPLGLVAGRIVWLSVANELGVSTDLTWPVLGIVLLVLATFVRGEPDRPVPGTPSCTHPPRRRPTIGVTVATSLDDIQPLDLASIRDDAPERPPWTSRAHRVRGAGGPRRCWSSSSSPRWSAIVCRSDPARPLAVVLVAGVGARRGVRRGPPPARAAGRDRWPSPRSWARWRCSARRWPGATSPPTTVRDFGCGLRGVAVALLPGVGLHLVLGVPDGALAVARPADLGRRRVRGQRRGRRSPARERPPRHRGLRPSWSSSRRDAVVGLVGYVARYRAAASVQERARLQWPAWGVVVAAAISLGTWVLHELAVVARPILRTVVLATTVLIPLSLALGAVGAARRCASTACSCTPSRWRGWPAMVAASYLLIVLGLGRSPTGDEKTLLGLSMLAAAIAALLWIPVRERLTEFATRRVYGERHAPDEVIRTFGSRLTRALPLDELLLQLAESLKKTMSLSVAEVWTRGATGRLERTVSVPDRGLATLDARGGGGDRRRPRRCVGRGVGEHLAPADHHRRRRGAAGRTHHEQR